MQKFSFKIAISIILAGLFVVVSFAAINYDNLTSPFYIISGLLVAFIFFFGFAMGFNYLQPVKELLNKARKAEDGDLKSKVELKTKDEIEELSKAFNKITEGLEKTKYEAETYKKTGDIKLQTKSILSDKVISALEEKIKNRTVDLEKAMVQIDMLKSQLRAKERETLDLNRKKRK